MPEITRFYGIVIKMCNLTHRVQMFIGQIRLIFRVTLYTSMA
jgi:hypothetical protein